MLINDLFHQIGMILKEINDCTEYLLDSFPVALCDNIRIFNIKLIKSENYRAEPETRSLRVTLRPKKSTSMELKFNY
jgi:hypothetical protein